LETTIASAPASTTMRASSTCWIPLTISGPDHASRSHSTSRTVRLGSNIRLMSSATVPSEEVRVANSSGSVVSRLSHHAGWVAASTTVRRVSDGGMVRPLRVSRSRAPATGTSTVRISAS
jgi:hypothetical protein